MSTPMVARAARTTPALEERHYATPRDADALEAVAVFLLIVIHIWFVSAYSRRAWLLIVAFAIYSHRRHHESLAGLGFRTENFGRCVRDFWPLIVGLAGVPLVLGAWFGTLRPWSLLKIVPFTISYCIWGTFQQYALNGYFVNRLHAAAGPGEQRWVPLLAATLFASAHAPNWFLVSVTFTLGVLCARIYLTYRNLFFLGIAHGIVGSALFISVPDWMSLHFHIGPRALYH